MNQLAKQILRVAILDSDPYSRSWNASLLMRDWRTRVVAELETYAQLEALLAQSPMPVDFVIVDLDNGEEACSLPTLLKRVQECSTKTQVIAISQKLDEEALHLFQISAFAGYLLKSEAKVSLAWAARECSAGFKLITPGVEKSASRLGLTLPKNCVVLEESEASGFLSSAGQFKVRLAFVMSMERDAIADEMQLELDSVFTLISRLYESVGVNDLREGDNWVQLLCGEDPILKEKIKAFLENKPGAPGKESVAFHLVTMPYFRKPRFE